MEYNVFEKVTISGQTATAVTVKTDLKEAKELFHQILASAYANEGLDKALAMVINDIGGVEVKEYYEKPVVE